MTRVVGLRDGPKGAVMAGRRMDQQWYMLNYDFLSRPDLHSLRW